MKQGKLSQRKQKRIAGFKTLAQKINFESIHKHLIFMSVQPKINRINHISLLIGGNDMKIFCKQANTKSPGIFHLKISVKSHENTCSFSWTYVLGQTHFYFPCRLVCLVSFLIHSPSSGLLSSSPIFLVMGSQRSSLLCSSKWVTHTYVHMVTLPRETKSINLPQS